MNGQVVEAIDILLVEDNPGDARLVRELLHADERGYHIHTVANGEEAMAFLYRQGDHRDAPRPDLILLDLNLPLVGGHDTLALIKKDPELLSIPVVVLTSSDAPSDITRIYQRHANAYLIKPTGLDHFATLMKAVEDFWLKAARLPSKMPR